MMMIKILLLFLFVNLSTTNEQWFVFDQYQFPGFYTPIITLTSTLNKQDQRHISFTLSTYDRSISIDISTKTANGTIKQQEPLIRLNIERADLLYNTINHMVFIAIRNGTRFETYVNCKLIDSYLLYSSISIDEYENANTSYTITSIAKNIEHYEITSTSNVSQQEIFDTYSCKTNDVLFSSNRTSSSIIGRPLIRKMQNVIEKVQQHKLRSRRQQGQTMSYSSLSSDSITIIYKPNLDKINENQTLIYTIFNASQFKFSIQYYPNEHLFLVRLNHENRTQFLLYAGKSYDRLYSEKNGLILFLHITPTMMTCFVNCELTDQEFLIDSAYMSNLIKHIMYNYQYEYNRQSTIILFNKSIDQVAANFFCLKLEKKNEELLPDKYTLRKFANALDVLVNTLDAPTNSYQLNPETPTSTVRTQDASAVNIPVINAFGSLKVPPSISNIESPSISNESIVYDKTCKTDNDCGTGKSSLICQTNHCICPKRLFWSSKLHRCIACHDLLIGNRCFRLSSHKSTWHEANDYCQDDSSNEEGQEYTMKLATNLTRNDIQYIKKSLTNDEDQEQVDYMYWIGATSNFDLKKPSSTNNRRKRQVPTTIFRWFDSGEAAKLNFHDIWCSQNDYMSLTTINNNQLCVSLTSCGLYTDDCQRNYRFLCEAI